MSTDPPDDALLSPEEVATWLRVDEGWVAQAVFREELPCMGFTSDGKPVVSAREVREWLRRPDVSWDSS